MLMLVIFLVLLWGLQRDYLEQMLMNITDNNRPLLGDFVVCILLTEKQQLTEWLHQVHLARVTWVLVAHLLP